MEFPQRIVFRGEIIEGFDAEEVKLSAKSRLNASLSQIEQLFSGRPAILKKDLDALSGTRYLALLAHIGMRATLEQQSAEQQTPTPAGQATATPFDPERTQLAGAAELARYINDAPAPVPASVPEPLAEAKPEPVAEPEPATTPEPVSIPERVASEVRRAGLSRHPEPSPTAQPPSPPQPALRISPAQQTDPQTVFFEEEAASQGKTPASPTKTGMRWPERLLLGLIAAGIGYTLYWAVTRY